ncbi:B12-binding domain-containing radical SAM protein [Kordia zhangzhouensis]|uniref:B12-binding domain-containing radical SAM protein n=1 Tax=Kordia zhangzhouensis TaxID=1620405 RepID=UPI000629958A|nr:B12-binding domain-containing radical SAM protein [Kordia zhangzhouensis]
MKVTLLANPIPGQSINGTDEFLGTVRPFMHKASLTALAAGLEDRLSLKGIKSTIEIIDMQVGAVEKTHYGIIDYGELQLDKYRIGIPFESIKGKILESDIIGLSANFTHSRKIISDLAKYCERINPKATIVIGGVEATVVPLYYLKNGADIVVKGEGEVTFSLIIESIYKRKGLNDIPNISYIDTYGDIKTNNNNFLKKNTQFNVATMLPPDLDIVNLSTYTDTGEGIPPYGIKPPFISVETSRGCAQACSFCATPQTKGRFRFMTLDTIRKHFEYFKMKGITTLLFQEDNILSRVHRRGNGSYMYENGREETLSMFRLAREMDFSWEFTNGLEFGQFEHNGVIDFELLETMFWRRKDPDRTKGCYRATIPLENLSDDNNKLFRKLKPFNSMKSIIKSLSEMEIDMLTFNLIIGRPEDDESILKLSYERCLEVKELVNTHSSTTQSYFNVYNLSLLPGTIDSLKLSNYLAFDLNVDPEVITFYLGCMNTPHFSPLEITQARGSMAKKLNGESLISDYDEAHYITSPKFDKLFS